VLEQDIADDPAAKPGDEAQGGETEQVHVLAARDSAPKQPISEDPEQVKHRGQ
jgi:hypothetical protein